MVVQLTKTEMKVLGLIERKRLSAAGLARKLGVSRVTIARTISALRKKGFPIDSQRNAEGWYYFHGFRKSRIPDPLENMIGMFSSDAGDLSENHDKYLYEME